MRHLADRRCSVGPNHRAAESTVGQHLASRHAAVPRQARGPAKRWSWTHDPLSRSEGHRSGACRGKVSGLPTACSSLRTAVASLRTPIRIAERVDLDDLAPGDDESDDGEWTSRERDDRSGGAVHEGGSHDRVRDATCLAGRATTVRARSPDPVRVTLKP